MSSNFLPSLSQGQLIEETYQVGFFLNVTSTIESYRVTDKAGEFFILRLFTSTEKGIESCAAQAALMQTCQKSFMPVYVSKGRHKINNKLFHYLVQEHISGELISERLSRYSGLSTATAKHIVLEILRSLDTLQSAKTPIIFNNINCQSIMVNMVSKDETYHLFGLDRAHFEGGHFESDIAINEIAYMATESLSGKGSIQSDLFSVGVILYRLLYGSLPWKINLSDFMLKSESIPNIVKKARSNGIDYPSRYSVCGSNLFTVVQKCLSEEPSYRFQTAQEFIRALEGKVKVFVKPVPKINVSQSRDFGFDAIAGMETLKETIKIDLIDALNEREKYKNYGLDIPNGLLLYGPPGCGKTFFAEQMAEEIGFRMFHIKPSDIQSKWVNATQENIKQLFDNARANAPSIVFIDELDAIVPKRDNERVSHLNTSAVNEFLAQMNNCGAHGVFVVAATNKPDTIDPAVLRTGRIDKKIYVPPPDNESRMKLFNKFLCIRPVNSDVNIEVLANKTKYYMSSDIKFICDEAARSALKKNLDISQKDLLNAIDNNLPSISKSELATYSIYFGL